MHHRHCRQCEHQEPHQAPRHESHASDSIGNSPAERHSERDQCDDSEGGPVGRCPRITQLSREVNGHVRQTDISGPVACSADAGRLHQRDWLASKQLHDRRMIFPAPGFGLDVSFFDPCSCPQAEERQRQCQQEGDAPSPRLQLFVCGQGTGQTRNSGRERKSAGGPEWRECSVRRLEVGGSRLGDERCRAADFAAGREPLQEPHRQQQHTRPDSDLPMRR